MAQNGSDYPVTFDVGYPESPSRLLALLGVLFFIKGILLIPHIIIIYFLNIASFAALYISYWAVLITGKYPRGLFNFQVSVQRWSLRITVWFAGWSDRYPPFSMS